MSRSNPRPSTVRAQSRSTPGVVPGPKFGTFTPISTPPRLCRRGRGPVQLAGRLCSPTAEPARPIGPLRSGTSLAGRRAWSLLAVSPVGHRRAHAGRDAELVDDLADVGADGAFADPEPGRDLAVGPVLGELSQDLVLTRAEHARISF